MKLINNPIMKGASGMLADTVVYREQNGQLIVANRPKKRDGLSDKQKVVKENFLNATYYAKGQVKNPVTKAEYATGITAKLPNAYSVALADFLKGPEITRVDASGYAGNAGDSIRITAVDNFKVTEVTVEIRANDDSLVEQGMAVVNPENPMLWDFTTTQSVANLAGTRVIVQAKDKPNNVTIKDLVLQ
jgi:hypothetical protein